MTKNILFYFLFALIIFEGNAQTNDSSPYCKSSAFTSANVYYITNVAIGDIDNSSNESDYSDKYTYFDNQTTNLYAGEEYTMSLSYHADSYQGHKVSVYIDYGNSGDEDNFIELDFHSEGSNANSSYSRSITFTVPTDADLGMARLRVTLARSDVSSDMCTSTSGQDGEMEDYKLNIKPSPVPPTAVCLGTSLDVALDIFGNATITEDQINNSSYDDYDASGDLILSLDKTTFTCADLGSNVVTLTVTDLDGLSDTCTATVNVLSYPGSLVDPEDKTIDAYCLYTAVAPVLYIENCNTEVLGTRLDGGLTTSDPITFSTDGSHSVTWTYTYGGDTVSNTENINIIKPPITPTGVVISDVGKNGATVNWTSSEMGPFKIKYKQTSDVAWSEINDIDGVSYILTNLNNDTEYDVQVAVDADCANYTSTVEFTTLELPYCETGGFYNSNFHMNNITLGSINENSNSGIDDYFYYKGVSTSVDKLNDLTGSISYITQSWTSMYLKIWIDYNQNGAFDNSELENVSFATGITSNTSPVSITIPDTALTGKTRMRVFLSHKDQMDPCFIDSQGNVQDFDIYINDRDTTLESAIITQVHHSDSDNRWIEITNNSPTEIAANSLSLALYKDTSGDQTGIIPDAEYTHSSAIPANATILIRKNTSATLTHTGTPVEDVAITDFDNSDDILIVTGGSGSAAWTNRFDVVSNITDETSYVRNDNITTYNNTYTSTEWTAFVDDSLDPYKDLASGGSERHPNDPLLSEVTSPETDQNMRLGVHQFGSTTRTGSAWDNGRPDRSRSVIVDEDYEETSETIKARTIIVTGTNTLTITNQLLVVSDNVIINADAEIRLSGTSQLVQTHTGSGLVSGTGSLLIDQNSSTTDVYRYNYLASPVNNVGSSTFTIDEVLKDGSDATSSTSTPEDINFVSGNDGATTSPITIAERWIYTYANNASGYAQKKSDGTLNQTDGFTLKGPGKAQNYTFVGTPKDGDITSATSMSTSDFYLTGNPYPSALNAKKFIEDNESVITGALYFWEHVGVNDGHYTIDYTGGYATRTKDMGVPADNTGSYQTPGNYIPVGQGFFVATDGNSGAINFNNNQREYITKGTSSVFFKTAASNSVNNDEDKSIIKLGVDYENNKDLKLHKQLGVVFDESLTFDYEAGHDAVSFNQGDIDLYWKFPNDANKYVIAGVPQITNDLKVPLDIKTGDNANLTFGIDESQNIENDVYLLDEITGDTYLLSNAKASIVLEPETKYTDRFALAFVAKTLSDSPLKETVNKIGTKYNRSENTIVISNFDDITIEKLALFALSGKLVKENISSDALYLGETIPLLGVYVLKIKTDKGPITKKIIL